MLVTLLCCHASPYLTRLAEPDHGHCDAWWHEGHIDRVGVPVAAEQLGCMELDGIWDWPAASKGAGVCEGCVGKIQQVLNQQACREEVRAWCQ